MGLRSIWNLIIKRFNNSTQFIHHFQWNHHFNQLTMLFLSVRLVFETCIYRKASICTKFGRLVKNTRPFLLNAPYILNGFQIGIWSKWIDFFSKQHRIWWRVAIWSKYHFDEPILRKMMNGISNEFGSKRFHQNKYLNNWKESVIGSDQNFTFN